MSRNHELLLEDKSFLVSETDEKGIIRFANDEFCKYAEYDIDELKGKPHNIVRHPDMPSEAFSDLWQCVKKGERWTGFVKNITRSGNYYWVFATVFPFTSGNNQKGFISCRKKASREEVKKYELLYKEMRREN